jgi:hypothetical protein
MSIRRTRADRVYSLSSQEGTKGLIRFLRTGFRRLVRSLAGAQGHELTEDKVGTVVYSLISLFSLLFVLPFVADGSRERTKQANNLFAKKAN